ncbi:vacuolar protein sorting-associated protein 25 [Heracleum sosnowskyi]|uniref:Vacuolar protein sorting-associated protein 25 n=1 Tax=Heracleum sosnowskyi TaxID=360622 RepID=A0AAD8HRM9_9APIA|nr:vacuolar protein sorting-associated protein 25 [Heracleum sosnowskyi]
MLVYISRLQPVRDTREKQIQLWKELILDYCRTQKIFVIELEKDLPLFTNPTIERSLTYEAKDAFLSALVSDEWMDKSDRKCLILWHRIQDWAEFVDSKNSSREGLVFTCGDNSSFCCGHADTNRPIFRPRLVETLKGVPYKQFIKCRWSDCEFQRILSSVELQSESESEAEIESNGHNVAMSLS